MINYHFRVIGIDPVFKIIEYDYPITDIEQKKEIMTLFSISYDDMENKLTTKELTVKYPNKEKRIYRTYNDNPENFLRYSIKEYLMNTVQLSNVMNILFPGTYLFHNEDIVWKLCITKTIDEEFYQ